jgi:acyl-CoA synthetase (AMP-forming)/AMP-acid ligase II
MTAARPAAFTLSVPFADVGAPRPDPDDVALVLHTSGTTSRPKIVPLRQRNLAASARQHRGDAGADAAGSLLVIMPLFHIHGLIGALLSSLHAGASVHCPPGFNALKFFAWLDEAKATWYIGGADHAPDHPRARRPQRRVIGAAQAALHPLILRLAAAAGDEGAGGDLRLARCWNPTA